MMHLLFLILFFPSYSMCRTSEEKAFEETQARIDELAAQEKFSGIVLVAKNEAPVFTHVVGIANREKNIPNTLDTKFNLASMGKMFTGVAIAQLAQQGVLKFTDTIAQHLPDYPNKDAAHVAIHQLLTHTGGVGDIFCPEFEEHQDTFQVPQDYINVYGKRKIENLPENCVVYSNYGYVILGAIIEKVSGQSFDAYVQEHIFNVLDMKDSLVYIDTLYQDDHAVGYHVDDANQMVATHFTGKGSPAGGSYSTATDILKFAQGIVNNKLLNQEYTQLITTGKVQAADYSYGYGFIDQQDFDGVRFFGHSGGCIGMNTELRIYPKSGYVIVMLSNSDRWKPSIVAEFVGSLLPDKA